MGVLVGGFACTGVVGIAALAMGGEVIGDTLASHLYICIQDGSVRLVLEVMLLWHAAIPRLYAIGLLYRRVYTVSVLREILGPF